MINIITETQTYMQTQPQKLISVVIVNYKVPQYLLAALESLRRAKLYDECEIIVVDNASNDNSREIITSQFCDVKWIQQRRNVGFGKACNVGVEKASGKYLLFLNPDAVVSEDTLASAVAFMETHPNAGLMGPKILNPDGTLQLSCRRSIPTPSVAFYYFAGLSYLFPKSKRFGRYHLTYMDEDETAPVEVISGSFMFMRRELFNEIGGFDKRFFMYGEDIDLCYRITQAGYEVWYYPETKIVHQKGKSSAKRRIRSRINFYGAMITFLRKYRGLQKSVAPWWLTWSGIVLLACVNIGVITARRSAAAIVDAAVINAGLWFGFMMDEVGITCEKSCCGYRIATIYDFYSPITMTGIHAAITFAYVFLFAYNGIYSPKFYAAKNLFFSWLLSSALVASGIYFLIDHENMRGIDETTAIGIALTLPLLFLWRWARSLFKPKIYITGG